MNEPIDYAALDVQRSATARPTAGKSSRWAIPLLVVLGGSAIAYLFASDYSQRQANLTDRENVRFQPPAFQARSFQEERPAPKENVVQIPKAPVELPGKQAWASEPGPQVDYEAQRRALEEQRLIEEARRQAAEDARLQEEARRLTEAEERARWERFRSGLIIVDNDRVGPLAPDGTGVGGALRPDQEADANRRFLAAAGTQDFDIARASKNFRTDALVAQGTMIRGVLETAIQSDLPGNVRAITSEDVYSFDGRRVLIPAGTRLIGEYRSGLARGQTRVFVVWTRLLRSDGVSVSLGSIGTDPLGRAGVGGEVDNHYVERFGSAILLTMVGGGAQYIAGIGQQQNAGSAGGSGIQVVDPATGRVTVIQQTNNQYVDQYGRQIASQVVAQSLTQLANEALRDSINIPPTVHVDQGTKISIFVRRDLDFSAFYPDPVRQEAVRLAARRVVRKDVIAVPAYEDVVIPGTPELLPGVIPARPVFKP